MMKKLVVLSSLTGVIAATLLFSGISSAKIIQKFVDMKDRFSIEVPQGWRIWEREDESTPFIAFRPKEKEDEVAFERIDITVLEDAGKDPDAFYQKHMVELKSSLPDFTLTAKGNEDFRAFPSSFLIYTYTDKFFTLKVQAKAKQWIVKQGARVYLITGTATIKTFPKYEEIFSKIASTFQIK